MAAEWAGAGAATPTTGETSRTADIVHLCPTARRAKIAMTRARAALLAAPPDHARALAATWVRAVLAWRAAQRLRGRER